MKTQIDPWGNLEVKDYKKLMKELGVDDFEQYSKKLKDTPLEIRRGLVVGHKDFHQIFNCMQKKQKFAILTGFMPSGPFHFGHMNLINQVIYYQSKGANIYLLAADLEAQLTRNKSLEETKKLAIEEYLLNWLALGLKTKNFDFYFQSEGSKEYMNLSKLASAKTTFNEVKAIYGELSPQKLISALTQTADILKPQLEGFKTTLTPVGFDQLPHANFSRDIAGRMNFNLPCFTFHKLLPGLQGVTTKMSSSRPETHISFNDDEKTVKEKIMKYAFSGGQATLQEHRKKGGNPDIDISFQWMKYIFEPNDKKLENIYNEYKSGSLLTGELKSILIERINKLLKEHNKKKQQSRKYLNKILAKK